MNLHNPVNSLSAALLHAMETGLQGVPSDVATALLGETAEGPRRRRPNIGECQVTMFRQLYRASDLYPGGGADDSIEGETVVVVGPQGDACVYFVGQLAYHIDHPNRRFFLDVAGQTMASVRKSNAYEGRDDAEIESMECYIEMELARLQSTVSHEQPERARAIASLLRSYAQSFDSAARTGAPAPVKGPDTSRADGAHLAATCA